MRRQVAPCVVGTLEHCRHRRRRHHPAAAAGNTVTPCRRYAKDVDIKPKRLSTVLMGWIKPVMLYKEEVGVQN